MSMNIIQQAHYYYSNEVIHVVRSPFKIPYRPFAHRIAVQYHPIAPVIIYYHYSVKNPNVVLFSHWCSSKHTNNIYRIILWALRGNTVLFICEWLVYSVRCLINNYIIISRRLLLLLLLIQLQLVCRYRMTLGSRLTNHSYKRGSMAKRKEEKKNTNEHHNEWQEARNAFNTRLSLLNASMGA